MSISIDGAYISDVLRRLSANPTSQDLDFLVEAFTRIGYFSAIAIGHADMAEAERKYREAQAVNKKKLEDPKASGVITESYATETTWGFREAEIKARTAARKLFNLHSAVEQAINSVKHIDKNTSVRIGP